ncbi:G-rich domain on putative tyrosine kinase [Halanaerobium congolense]|jgi:capsular polysaccharide biosynthesis protein|uniref:G-rich domain on putative tyrosine kinase n=1 Tax=Halanaerobium congolense TaxID=54121 RepID=A0A1I0DBT1_9FIRM|nr:Wzz/FepE/Etk N-terminal domain-containing protein [Halanaerobium congolense]PTX14745.1 subunit length determinant protein [Halanaerobium congolense]PTX14815.1 subunit length determinant protein [Halanaerobium congolense]SDG27650.1 G-rich domain on putative tyrosine kinase [Halanaerobium congolense]SET29432.1 G-rich domain on putative tyrosine kinase [Halanaerobium congolense]SFP82447.1 G-rich domain on putative tyrosine kinase [Halanaerobium congolense]
MEDTNYDEYEINLVEYIMLLWNNKFFIISLVILAILIAFVYSTFIIEPVYEAKSTLLILTPKYKSSLEVESFSINTYKNLAMTDSIKQKIIDNLDLKNEDGERYSVKQLDNMMEIEILASEENDNGDAPLIELRVSSKEPELAADIANAWAKNFIADSKEIRQNEVREVATVIQEQFEDTEKKLNNLKSDLLAFNKENRLGLLKQRLKNKENSLNQNNKNIINLENELGSKNAQFKNTVEQVESMEENNIWIGELNNKNYSDKNYDLLKIKNLYVNYQEQLKLFNQKNDLTLLQEKIKSVRNNIIKYKTRISEFENNSIELKEENKGLSNIIEEENERWIISRSIDNNTLWNNLLSETEINILEKLKLEDEMVNPIYKKAKDNLTENLVIFEKIQPLIEYYNRQINNEKSKLQTLNKEYYFLKLKKDNININLSNYRDSYNNYAQKYKELINKKLNLELKIEEIKAELDYYKNNKGKLTSEIKEMQNQLWEGENKKSLIKQQIDDVQKTYNSLASRVEEARITEAQRTSDVKFYAEAIKPSSPLTNNNRLNMAIAAVLALMLAIFIVFFKEFIKNADLSQYE